LDSHRLAESSHVGVDARSSALAWNVHRRLVQVTVPARSREPADVAHALGAFSCLVGLRAAAATIVGCIEPGGKLLRWSVGHDARCSTTYGAREPVGDVFFQI